VWRKSFVLRQIDTRPRLWTLRKQECNARIFVTLRRFRTTTVVVYKNRVLNIIFMYQVCVLILSTGFVWNFPHSKKKWAKCYPRVILMLSSCYSSQISMKLEFSVQVAKNTHKISWKSIQWEQSCSMRKHGRTYIHDEANSHFRISANILEKALNKKLHATQVH
jgi:hypothetical protein